MTANFNDKVNGNLSTSGNVSDTVERPWYADAASTANESNAVSVAAAGKSTINPGLLIFLGCAAVLACGFLAASMAANSFAAYMDYDAFIEVEYQILKGILSFLWSLVTGIFGLFLGMLGL